MKSEDILFEKLDTLPEEIQRTAMSIELTNTLTEIGKKYQLHLDILDELVDEVRLVLLGETKTGEFIDHLTKRLAVPREKAAQIAADVNEQVFVKVRDALKELTEAQAQREKEDREAADTEKTGNSAVTAPTPEVQPSRDTILAGVENPELATLAGDVSATKPKTPTEEQAEILRSIESPGETPFEGNTAHTTPKTALTTPLEIKPVVQPGETHLALAGEPGGPIGEGILPTPIKIKVVSEQKTPSAPPSELVIPEPISSSSVPPAPEAATAPSQPQTTQTSAPKPTSPQFPPRKTQIPPVRPTGSADPYREPIN
jgi:hypothetical protein